MNARRCLKIAARIDTVLQQELGIGVDAHRLLTERLYMRDVLLVCDAHVGHELAQLARWFRMSAAEMPAEAMTAGRDAAGSADFVAALFDALRPAAAPTAPPVAPSGRRTSAVRAAAEHAAA